MSTQTVLSPYLPPLTPLSPTRKTQIMSILNLTPDSFSDGGQHPPSDRTYLNYFIQSHLDAGATILDIGGQSSRPGAASISPDQELSRILPAIEVARQMDAKIALSVDTYRSTVAEKAIMAGAHMINDISAGQMDPDMLKTVARLGCTVILMHMRGTPETMMEKRFITYEGDLIATVGNELRERIHAAEAAGIRRWRIILDPGIGFAKNLEHNLEILRRFSELREYPGLEGLPWVVGVSRKSFIGRITDVQDPKDRTWGTAGAVTAAIQGGVDIVRVHDVDEMAKVVKMADAIWRN